MDCLFASIRERPHAAHGGHGTGKPNPPRRECAPTACDGGRVAGAVPSAARRPCLLPLEFGLIGEAGSARETTALGAGAPPIRRESGGKRWCARIEANAGLVAPVPQPPRRGTRRRTGGRLAEIVSVGACGNPARRPLDGRACQAAARSVSILRGPWMSAWRTPSTIRSTSAAVVAKCGVKRNELAPP